MYAARTYIYWFSAVATFMATVRGHRLHGAVRLGDVLETRSLGATLVFQGCMELAGCHRRRGGGYTVVASPTYGACLVPVDSRTQPSAATEATMRRVVPSTVYYK